MKIEAGGTTYTFKQLLHIESQRKGFEDEIVIIGINKEGEKSFPYKFVTFITR